MGKLIVDGGQVDGVGVVERGGERGNENDGCAVRIAGQSVGSYGALARPSGPLCTVQLSLIFALWPMDRSINHGGIPHRELDIRPVVMFLYVESVHPEWSDIQPLSSTKVDNHTNLAPHQRQQFVSRLLVSNQNAYGTG